MTVRYAVMLRGINVGGNRKLPMADLRVLLTELGYGRVETYIQSGNVALDALPLNDTGGDATELAETLAGQISERFGFEVPVEIARVDLTTGARVAAGSIAPEGIGAPATVLVADWQDDGRAYAYNYTSVPSVLFVVTGARP